MKVVLGNTPPPAGLLASQTEPASWEGVDEAEAAVEILLPCAGLPANVTVFVGKCGHGEDSGGVLAASFCVLRCE